MATTAAQICNIALLRIGQRQTIDDLDQNNASAKACNALFENSRVSVLSRVPWKFAEAHAVLAELADAEFSGWTYVYALPSDCVTVRYLYAGSRNPGKDEREPYAIKYDATTQGRVLVTDLEEAELVYTCDPGADNIAIYPPLFVDALAWKLASDLALALPVKPQVGLAMEQKYLRSLAEAAAVDLNQEQLDPQPDSELITGR